MTMLIQFLLFGGLVMLIGLVPGIRVKGYGTALLVALVFSLLNFGVNLLFFWLIGPLNVVTLGLTALILNTFLLWLTDQLVDDFEINGLPLTFVAAILLTIGQVVISRLIH